MASSQTNQDSAQDPAQNSKRLNESIDRLSARIDDVRKDFSFCKPEQDEQDLSELLPTFGFEEVNDMLNPFIESIMPSVRKCVKHFVECTKKSDDELANFKSNLVESLKSTMSKTLKDQVDQITGSANSSSENTMIEKHKSRLFKQIELQFVMRITKIINDQVERSTHPKMLRLSYLEMQVAGGMYLGLFPSTETNTVLERIFVETKITPFGGPIFKRESFPKYVWFN